MARIATVLTRWNQKAREAPNVSASAGLVSVPDVASLVASIPAEP